MPTKSPRKKDRRARIPTTLDALERMIVGKRLRFRIETATPACADHHLSYGGTA